MGASLRPCTFRRLLQRDGAQNRALLLREGAVAHGAPGWTSGGASLSVILFRQNQTFTAAVFVCIGVRRPPLPCCGRAMRGSSLQEVSGSDQCQPPRCCYSRSIRQTRFANPAAATVHAHRLDREQSVLPLLGNLVFETPVAMVLWGIGRTADHMGHCEVGLNVLSV